MISTTNLILIVLIGYINAELISTTREPSIQAYGLPKRFFTDNGYIERIYLGKVNEKESKVGAPKIDSHSGDPSNMRWKFAPKDDREEGTIEVIHLDPSEKHETNSRNRRDIENRESSEIGEDMQAEESKVFRPLFVYRQQVAKRERIQREKNVARNLKPRYNSNNKNSLYYYPQ